MDVFFREKKSQRIRVSSTAYDGILDDKKAKWPRYWHQSSLCNVYLQRNGV